MAMVDTGGLRMHVQRLGPGDDRPATATVVLVHGLLTDSLASYYFTVAPPFAAAGLDVVMYDLRGHGRSGRPASGYTLDDGIDDLEALLDALEVRGPLHLVGNSYGGTVAFGYAARHPERAASVCLIESEPATASWAAKLGGILDRVTRELAHNEADALAWITAHRGHNTARLAKGAARLARETTLARDIPASRVLTEDRIRAVRCPVLGVYGGDSDLALLAPWLGSLLPDCRTVVVPGHEHSVLVEAAGVVGEQVLSLIRRASAGSQEASAPVPEASTPAQDPSAPGHAGAGAAVAR
ncbi:alpha/beta hydrolase [Streptomyces sp. NBC_00289]|uniref:alpha/beta fold hydrolase n=1 Tax=Streptomyces sp. NBC_00289 TaxID=2975703 RepID=UPI00324E1B2C